MGKCKMAILLCLMAWTVQAQIRVSEWPEGKEGLKRNPDYEVYVKPLAGSDSEWRQVPNLDCEVDVRKVRHASFAEFEMGGPVAVKVRNCRADALGADGRMAVKVKPASRGIVARQVDERTVEFALQRPEFLSVEFNGERKQNLHVFANAMLTETYTGDEPGTINWTAPNAQDIFMQDARLIYFGPGVHKPKDLPSGEIKIPSHTT
ncbi:MAG TPA: glycoside hydrolase, partial [Paraprevotella xylaniphila]|nr:glycoside hydrolase [Paraprevotella xylaniphila]